MYSGGTRYRPTAYPTGCYLSDGKGIHTRSGLADKRFCLTAKRVKRVSSGIHLMLDMLQKRYESAAKIFILRKPVFVSYKLT